MITKGKIIELADLVKGLPVYDENGRPVTLAYEGSKNIEPSDLINALANWIEKDNPRFNRPRFIAYINGECGPNGGKI